MCLSNDSHNLRMYPVINKIIEESTYHVVGLEISGGTVLEFNTGDTQALKQSDIIKSVILSDGAGMLFSVAPDLTGLKFASGKISYEEYKRLKKKADRLSFGLFGGIVAFLFATGFLFLKLYLT